MGRTLEARGTTAEEAVRHALSLLRVPREMVDIEVLDPGRRGLLRGKRAHVRVTVRDEAAGSPAPASAPDPASPPGPANALAPTSGVVSATSARGEQADPLARPPADVPTDTPEDPAGAADPGAADQPPAAVPRTRPASDQATRPNEEPEEDPVSDTETETNIDELAEKPEEELTDEEFMELLDRDADLAADFIEGLLDLLDLPGDIEIVTEERQALVTVQDVGSGLLIGRRGATLDALQELVRCAIQRQTERRTHVRVDVEGYRARQLDKLRDKCREAIAEVRESGEPARLEPMDAYERKMMHDLVGKTGGVTSSSEGNEPRRRVVIHPAD